MSSGLNHDKATKFWCVPFGFFIGLLTNWELGVLAGFSFVIGGLWLSPDLDTHSNSLKRWGILQFIWWPYRKFIPHRSLWSHGPFIGTSIRIVYITLWKYLIIFFIQLLNFTTPSLTSMFFNIDLIHNYRKIIVILFLGVEASAWLHIIQDGDPFVIKWKNWKMK